VDSRINYFRLTCQSFRFMFVQHDGIKFVAKERFLLRKEVVII